MEQPQRKWNRLPEYDYTETDVYFITICTQERQQLFFMEQATKKGTGMALTGSGSNQIIHKWVAETERKYPGISVDLYVVMPNHIHMLLATKNQSLPDIMRFFKTMTTNEYIQWVKTGRASPFHGKLWQKSYYDHIIRNQRDYNEIWQYIENNPQKWRLTHGENAIDL